MSEKRCKIFNLGLHRSHPWSLAPDLTESNLIKVIIKDVLKKVNKLLVEIEKKYEEPRPKGGIGKTTLAEDLYAKAKHSVKKATSLSISCSTTKPYLKVDSKINIQQLLIPNISAALSRSCEPKDSSEENELQKKRFMLNKGSPIIFIDAPKVIKTQASSIPWPNFGLVKRGNVGRVVSKKSNDVWAVRLSIGIYIIEGKYFKPLDLAEYI
ncbi:DUF3148 family protein [Trifolium repens]|nr:DUF3148 family protein [Trifolium repens]